MSIELQIQGRVVQGHPLTRRDILDDNGKPVHDDQGQKKTQIFFALAVPKNAGETDWGQTAWGAQIKQVGQAGYPNGETQRPDFSWKVEDGDSPIPNKKGVKNCDREGFPGHWIIKCSTRLSPPCFPYGKYLPTDAMTDHSLVKCGDFVVVLLEVMDNKNNGVAAKTPGVYLNPKATVYVRPGQEIISESTIDAVAAFSGLQIADAVQPGTGAAPAGTVMPGAQPGVMPGAQPGVMPGAQPGVMPGAQPGVMPGSQPGVMPGAQPGVMPGAQPGVMPATDLVQPGAALQPPAAPEESYNVSGQIYTRSQLLAMPGWTEAHLVNLPRV